MADLVETMFYVRETPWHGLGTMVEDAPNSKEALKLAGLDWKVIQKDVYTDDGLKMEGYKANIRDKDNAALSIVSDRYCVVQNDEAFAFTDALLDNNDIRYETAGSLMGGRKIWLLARLPETEICGDIIEPYLCFSNTHDCSGAVRVCVTNIRVVCNNTLNIALNSASRFWSVRHIGNIEDKLEEAKRCLDLANDYISELKKQAEIYANTYISEEQLQEILSELFPTTSEMSKREKENIQTLKDEFMTCYDAADIAKFKGTAWGVINAMSDMATHMKPRRKTKTYRENNWNKIMNGHPLIDGIVKACNNYTFPA